MLQHHIRLYVVERVCSYIGLSSTWEQVFNHSLLSVTAEEGLQRKQRARCQYLHWEHKSSRVKSVFTHVALFICSSNSKCFTSTRKQLVSHNVQCDLCLSGLHKQKEALKRSYLSFSCFFCSTADILSFVSHFLSHLMRDSHILQTNEMWGD